MKGVMSIRKSVPHGGIAQLAKRFEYSPTWIAKILDGEAPGHEDVLEAAIELIEKAKTDGKTQRASYRRKARKVQEINNTQNRK